MKYFIVIILFNHVCWHHDSVLKGSGKRLEWNHSSFIQASKTQKLILYWILYDLKQGTSSKGICVLSNLRLSFFTHCLSTVTSLQMIVEWLACENGELSGLSSNPTGSCHFFLLSLIGLIPTWCPLSLPSKGNCIRGHWGSAWASSCKCHFKILPAPPRTGAHHHSPWWIMAYRKKKSGSEE